MSFTAVILKLPFSALSTVRWGAGRRNAPRKGAWTLRRQSSARRSGRWPREGCSWRAAGMVPLEIAPRAAGEEGLHRHRVQLLRAGVPQLFPADCFAYVLEKDMALSFGNHSSAQWVQQGANTCETPTGAAPSPFLKHFFLFVCLFAFRETNCRLIWSNFLFAPYTYKTLQLCIKVQVVLVHLNYAGTMWANPIKIAIFCVYKQHLFLEKTIS